jgi:hypothetical protein
VLHDGDSRGHHVAPTRTKESENPPSDQGSVTLIARFLMNGVHGWRPIVHHSYEYGASVISLERKTQVAEAVGSELEAPKADGFTWGEPNIG